MQNNPKGIELLAPAKNLQYGIAAINAGADAVYIGAIAFGARKSAGNSIEDIQALAEYAHKFYAKVYVTINTIFDDSEIEEVQRTIEEIHKAKADAIIIQDMGILKMELPDIPIFASTQTNNYSIERVKFLESVGISRIILARELSLPQIKEISQNTNCELESFVFGALCVSLSGQCYISQAICGRSANRGHCAQMCRHSYSLYDSSGNVIMKNKYLLSLKDLNLENKLEELIDAGISSFKIEGRLKDINYLINSVSYFRKKIDEIINRRTDLKKTSTGSIFLNFVPELSKTFNRGFTEYFIDGKCDYPANISSPKSIGSFIGTVKHSSHKQIRIDTKFEISAGDGLCYYKPDGELCGFRVNRAEDKVLHLFEYVSITPGTKLYRNQDVQFEKQISNSPCQRKISVNIYQSISETGFTFTAIDEDGNTASTILVSDKVPAEDKAKSLSNITKQLNKTGNTIFELAQSEILPEFFIKVSDLNSARRELFHTLEQVRIANYSADKQKKIDNSYYPPGSAQPIDYSFNIMNSLAEKFYKDKFGINTKIEYAPESTKNYDGFPLMTSKYCIREQLGKCPKLNKSIDSAEPLFLRDNADEFRVEFDCKECMMKIYKSKSVKNNE